MLKKTYPYYLAGEATHSAEQSPVTDKYTQEVVTTVSIANQSAIDQALSAAADAKEAMRRLAPFQRKEILNYCVARFKERFDELANSLCIEAGKPIRDARGEVTRLIDTFEIAAEESVRLNGEVMNLEISPRAKGYRGIYQRVPVGVCSLITPFNFPLNLVAHKIAPAIATGCPFILKPATKTPLGALLIGEVLAECDLPRGSFSILPCDRRSASSFTTDERIQMVSFTGSPDVGWKLKQQSGKKKVTLELGGNAACIIDHDADIQDATARLIIGAFYQSGQSCIGVQRIIAHQDIYPQLKASLVEATTKLICGDPKQESTFVGPMISESEAERLHHWIKQAEQLGGKILCGGERSDAMLQPTLLENVPREAQIYCEEAFGPVAVLSTFNDFDDAIDEVNDSVFGLQAGIFTRDLYKAQKAWDELEVGGVIIGDVPSWRVDNMPYGGVKNSGLGREGVRFAMEEMTEIRTLITRTPK